MEVHFRSKEESNKIQQEEFLKLSPAARIYAFLDLMYKMRKYPTLSKTKKNDNFLIVIKDD